MLTEVFSSAFAQRRFKFSRARRRLQCFVSQAAYRAVRWQSSTFGCCLCFSYSCNDSKMSSSWRLLEATPNLLESFSRSLNSVANVTLSLEQNGLLSADIVDHAMVDTQLDPIQELVKRIVIKDEDSFRRFKRTLIESGEYDAVEILCEAIGDLQLPPEPQQQQQQQQQQLPPPIPPPPMQDQPFEHPPRVTGSRQLLPWDQQLRLSLMQRNSTAFSTESESSLQPGDTRQQEEEVDAKPEMKATASSSSSTTVHAMLSVRKAQKFTTGPRIYTLTDSPRGLCVIFNNRNFPSCRDRDRPGSELDVQRMKMLFEEFNFMVFTHIDQPSEQMISLLDTYANENVLEGHQAFVLILMSHGELNHIYGNDYVQVKLQNIFEKFNNFNCPALRERPKLFFVQACRGDQPDNGTEARDPFADIFGDDGVQSDAGMFVGRAASGGDDVELPKAQRRISFWSDMYIAYAVVEGYESLRDMNSGSWFMKAVFDVMARYAHAEDLDTLMERVSHRVLEKARSDGQRQCPEVKKIGWRKKLYFNPGLGN